MDVDKKSTNFESLKWYIGFWFFFFIKFNEFNFLKYLPNKW